MKALTILLSLLLAACGGGGGDPEECDPALVAYIGAPRAIQVCNRAQQQPPGVTTQEEAPQ